MEANEAALAELGLSKNEAKIYLFLLKKGSTTTGAIIKETNIANSRVYESLNTLISKGLVSYTIEKDGKHFQAAEPKKLLEIEEERKDKIAKIVPELAQLQKLATSETKSAIYEGFEGFKTAFKKIIDDCPENETIYILGFSEPPYADKSLRTFISNMNLKSAEKKQKLKILLEGVEKTGQGLDRKREKYTETRYMPKGYISPAAIDIFQDYIYMFVWEEKPFVFMIKNKIVADSFKNYFEFLWDMAKA
ncbi:helix-turn-helix domain-containing protein [Candidatus Woesearchaeota archaeon]|nr:helix-turn-helix domain-containing protein [Candidatus Woesearchaeota archaeon]